MSPLHNDYPNFSAGIHAQHKDLARLLGALEKICRLNCYGRCSCLTDAEEKCSSQLIELAGGLMSCMVAHFRYEEQAIHAIPPSEAMAQHVLLHRRAHTEISRNMANLVGQLDGKNPAWHARRLVQAVRDWQLSHREDLDSELLKMATSHDPNTPW